MKNVNVGKEFYHRLANRDKRQGDGRHNAEEFRLRYFKELDNKEAWLDDSVFVILDFADVKVVGPSFANEAFAYFTIYATPEQIKKKILFENISVIDTAIIDTELKAGYDR